MWRELLSDADGSEDCEQVTLAVQIELSARKQLNSVVCQFGRVGHAELFKKDTLTLKAGPLKDVCFTRGQAEHAETVPDDEVEDNDKLKAVAHLLIRCNRKVLTDQSLLSKTLGVSRRSLMRYLSATAEASLQLQGELLQRVLQYCKQMQQVWQPLLFVHGLKFDETPIRLIGKLQGHEAETMLNKVFVIETTWRILLKKPGVNGASDEFMLLHGTLSPQCRFGENTTACTIAALLSTCWEPPPMAAIFKHKWRILETDSAAGNMKAERIKMATPALQEWKSLHGNCVAHRVHAVAAKLFDCPGSTQYAIKGCIRSLLVLQAPGAMRKFKAAVLDLCITQPVRVIVNHCLVPEALQYREKVHGLFRRAFLKAFEKVVENPTEVDAWRLGPVDAGDILADAGSNDDKIALWRHEMSQHLRIALAWWSTEDPEWHLYLLRTVLEPERHLMNELLQITASGWQLKEMQQRRATGLQSIAACQKLDALPI
eukprot:6456931-Amphidinium_carterae.3